MKRRTLSFTLAALGAVLMVGLISPQAQAQGRGRNRSRGNGAGNPQAGGFGQAGGAGIGGQRGAAGRFGGFNAVDPTRSAMMTLLQHDEVKNEIKLTQRQAEDMAAEDKKMQDEAQKKMQEARPDRAAMKNLSQEDRRAKTQESRQKIQELRQELNTTSEVALDKKAQEVLTPEQISRLKELDLQWRGALALADPKVAEQFKLTQEQKTQIAALLADYRKSEQTARTEAFAGMGGGRTRNRGANGAPADPNAAPAAPAPPVATQPQLDPAAIQAKMTEAQEKIEKTRQEADTKAAALLTEEQKTAWKTAQGAKFTFRKQAVPAQ